MLFNSVSFAVFLAGVLCVYWAAARLLPCAQNLIILAASYFFYGMWDWRFLGLLVLGTLADFLVGIAMGRMAEPRRRKALLWADVVFNLGLLGFFKYFGFFLDSIAALLGVVGMTVNPTTMAIILPVGISYYTFKKLSYVIDVHDRRVEPERDPVAFFGFVAFFPQILAGPIDRATTLLPQFRQRRVFDELLFRDGTRQILAGFLKKLVFADNLLPLVNDIFTNHGRYDGLTIVIGVFFAAMQIYCDFSGYSDIAIGVGKLLGFRITPNFAFPYFSRDIAEFWRRWHISLSTWLRDYLYVPLCGPKPTRNRKGIFIVLTFTLCGLWHGPNWRFIFWGFLHGLYFLPMTLKRRHHRFIGTPAKGRFLPGFRETRAMAITFLGTSVAWVFFMGESFTQAFGVLGRIFLQPFQGLDYSAYLPLLGGILVLLGLEWFQREKEFFLQIERFPRPARWGIYCASIIVILVFGAFGSTEFLYTQF